MIPQAGIVVPTLGQRDALLRKCLQSIRAAGNGYIVIVGPRELDISKLKEEGLVDSFTEDQNKGLASAINQGARSLPKEIEFFNWLGDDDLLSKDSLNFCVRILDENPEALMVYGACDYIDPLGRRLWTNRPGKWAIPLLRFGPDLIPQPGALFRREIFDKVGALNENLKFAFDFDLFIKLSKEGRLYCIDRTLASFRWHPESLSVGRRVESVREASKVRVSHLPVLVRPISSLWEPLVTGATLVAGAIMNQRARKLARST